MKKKKNDEHCMQCLFHLCPYFAFVLDGSSKNDPTLHANVQLPFLSESAQGARSLRQDATIVMLLHRSRGSLYCYFCAIYVSYVPIPAPHNSFPKGLPGIPWQWTQPIARLGLRDTRILCASLQAHVFAVLLFS